MTIKIVQQLHPRAYLVLGKGREGVRKGREGAADGSLSREESLWHSSVLLVIVTWGLREGVRVTWDL